MVIDNELSAVSRRAAVNVLDAHWNVGGRRQRSNVYVITLTTHRLHLLRTPPGGQHSSQLD